MAKITKKEVQNIADLARIDLTGKEKEKMTDELGAVLEYVGQLQEVDPLTNQGQALKAQEQGQSLIGVGVDTSNIKAGINPHHDLTNALRKDDKFSHEPGENTEKLLKQAPETKNGFVKVKAVFEKK